MNIAFPSLDLRLDAPLAILRSPNSPVCVEIKSRLDRRADGFLHAHGFDVFGRPRAAARTSKAMSRKTSALLDVMLELRRNGCSLCSIARQTGLHRNTVSAHFAQLEGSIAVVDQQRSA
jgi:DNA-binding transcriptional ArsR family regulator